MYNKKFKYLLLLVLKHLSFSDSHVFYLSVNTYQYILFVEIFLKHVNFTTAPKLPV